MHAGRARDACDLRLVVRWRREEGSIHVEKQVCLLSFVYRAGLFHSHSHLLTVLHIICTHTHTHTHSVVRNTIARSTIGGSTLLYDSSRDLTIVLTSNCLAAHPNAAREIVDLVCDLLDLGAPLDLFA